jgi:hypothetical protein
MEYTKENLESVLRKIDPKTFEFHKETRTPTINIVKYMFIVGFFRTLKGHDFHKDLTHPEISILCRAYSELESHLQYDK